MIKLILFSIFRKWVGFFSGRKIGLWKIPLLKAVYHFIFQLILPKYTEIEGSKMYTDDCRWSILYSLPGGNPEKYETELFKKNVKDGSVVVDVGANFGFYTLLAAKLGARWIYAFEPEPKNYNLLTRNIQLNKYKNIIAIQKAICDRVATTKMFLSRENPGDHRIYDSGDKRKSIQVNTITLDQFFEDKMYKVDVIKMDIQGSEPLAFLGGGIDSGK